MKRLRKLLLWLLIPIVLIVALIALAFLPAVQTAVARRVLASQPGMTATVDRVAVGFSSVRVNGFKFAQPGLAFDLPALELDAPLLDAAKSRVSIQRLSANGWTATLSLPELAANAAAPSSTPAPDSASDSATKPFNGLFELIQLPVDLSIGTLESSGHVTIITAPGASSIQAAATLKGGNLSAGQTGKFTLALQVDGVELPAALAAARQAPSSTAASAVAASPRIELEATLEARMATPRTLDSLQAALNAKAGSEAALVRLAAFAAAAGKPEEFSAYLDTKGATRARVTGKWHPGTRTAEGDWTLNLSDTDIAPYTAAAGIRLPAFVSEGQGSFTYALASGDATTAGRLQVRGGVGDFVPELGNTEVVLVTEFDAGLKAGNPRVESFSATVSTGQPLVSIRAVQPFAVDAARAAVTAADPAKDLVRIELPGVPLSLVEPFLAGAGLKIKGTPIRGSWVAWLDGDTARLATEAPLAFELTDVKQNGQTLAANLSFSIQNLAAAYSAKGWEAAIGKIAIGAVSAPGAKPADAVTLSASASQAAGAGAPLAFKAEGAAQLALLAAQPVLAALEKLTGGTLAYTVQGALGDDLSAKASVKLDGLRTRATTTTPAATLPAVALDADLARTAAGVLTVKAPVHITNSAARRTSDLSLNATLTPGGDALDARIQVTSDVFYVADAQAFAAVLGDSSSQQPAATQPPASTPPAAPSTAPAGPPWAGLTGELSLLLKKIVYTDELQITDVGGTIKITPDALALDAIKAILGGSSSLKLDGKLTYDAAKPDSAYALKTDLAVKDFETAPWIRAFSADSSQPAVLETKLNIDGSVTSAAPSLTAIAERAQGQFNLASVDGGICRVLAGDLAERANKLSSTASKATDLVSGIAGLLGKSDKTAKAVGKAQELIEDAKEIAAYFEEIKFTQFSLAATRGSDLNAVLQNLTLISPELRLTGGGQITHADGIPLVNQLLSLQLSLSAKDKLAKLFERTKLAGGAPDADGYTPFFTPVNVGGTLENVDTSSFTNAVYDRLAQLGGGVLGNLFDKK